MSSAKAAAFVALMFALATAQDKTSQDALRDLPLPWFVATLQFGAGMLWVFPAWTVGVRQTPSLNDVQKAKIAPLAFLHAAGHLCTLGVLGAGSLAIINVFQAAETLVVCLLSLVVTGRAQHVTAWLALLPLMAGVLVTFRQVVAGSLASCILAGISAVVSGARTAFSHQVMVEEAVALKGQLCSVIFVLGCLVLIPFAIIMEGAQLVDQWERAAAQAGNSALIIKLLQGGTLFYMWSECLFGLIEEAGELTAAVAVAIRPVAVYAFSAVFLGGGWTAWGGVGTVLTALGAALFSFATRENMLTPPRSKQQ